MHEPDWARSVLRYGGRLQAGRRAAGGSADVVLQEQALQRAAQAREPGTPPPGDLHALAVRLYMLWNYD